MTTDTATPQGAVDGEALPVDSAAENDQLEAAFAEITAQPAGDDADPLADLQGRDDGDAESPAAGDGDDAAGTGATPSAGDSAEPAESADLAERLRVAEEKLRRSTGQVSALNKRWMAAREQLEKASAAGAAPTALTAAEQAEWDRLAADYPDVARLAELVAKKSGVATGGASHEVLAAVATLAEQAAGTAQAEFASTAEEAMAIVEGQRPGWKTAVQTEGFKRFVQSRPALHGLFQSSSIEDTIALYDIFRAQHPAAQQAAGSSPAAAASPNRGATDSVAHLRQQRVAQSEGIAGRTHAIGLEASEDDLESAFNAAVRDLERRKQLHR